MKILLCDDEKHAINRLKNSVASVCPDAQISDFTDPTEALEAAKGNPPDIAFLDIQMSEINGIILAKSLKEINPDMHLIFCTGYSEYALDAFKLHANGYILKPYEVADIKREISALSLPKDTKKGHIYFQTFGNFDVFVDGKLINFSRSKSKEILAFITSQNGKETTADQLALSLWDNSAIDRAQLKQLYVFIGALKKDLSKANIGDILIKTERGYALDRDKINCDFFRVLNGDIAAINLYTGEFMAQYSWSEMINAVLSDIKKQPKTFKKAEK